LAGTGVKKIKGWRRRWWPQGNKRRENSILIGDDAAGQRAHRGF
jgi:hypothetical protein